MIKGDIVALRGKVGLWVFDGVVKDAIPVRSIGRFIRGNRIREAVCLGLAMAQLVAEPSFSPGQVVRALDGEHATVVSDDAAGGFVELSTDRTPQPHSAPDGERWSPQVGRVTADRALLVQRNLGIFI